jgi:hypothetical protein
MVTVSGYRVVETEDGEYIRLVLSGDLEMVRSETTGNYYATTRQATISATFDEHTAKKMIGKELPGTIERVEVEPYEIETPTGTLNRDNALDFLLQGRIASNTGTSSIFDARHDGDHAFPSASGSFARRSTRSSLCLTGTNRSFMPSKTSGAPVFIALLPFMTKP